MHNPARTDRPVHAVLRDISMHENKKSNNGICGRESGMKRLSTVLVLIVLLTGCSPYKAGRIDPYAGLPISMAKQTASEETRFGGSEKWWESFKDQKLNALVERALEQNLEIKGAGERAIQAREIAHQAGAERLPGISADFSAARAREKGIMGTETANAYSLSATASYELDLWGKLSSRARAALYDSEAEAEQLRASYVSVSAEAAEQYFSVIEQNEIIALSDLSISSLKNTLKSVELRYSAGLVSSLDVYQARQNLAINSTERPGYKMKRQAALAALAFLLGQGPEQAPESNGHRLPEPSPLPEGFPSSLIMSRPDVRAALLALRASDERVAAAVAERFPSFSLSLAYGGANEKLKSILESPNIFWNVLLQTAMPIFEGGKRKSEVRRSKSVLRENLALYHGTVLNALREAHVAIERNRNSEKQVRLLEKSVQAGLDTLRVAEDQYLQGITDYINLLNSQQQLYAARNSLVQAKRGLLSARIELARALGGFYVDGETKIQPSGR
jgi:NodT family efflux transporter outer membrane factor (OMF) lipoprotein